MSEWMPHLLRKHCMVRMNLNHSSNVFHWFELHASALRNRCRKRSDHRSGEKFDFALVHSCEDCEPETQKSLVKNHFQTTHNAVNYMVYIKLSPLIFQVNGVVIEMDRELDGENLRVLFNVLVFRWPLHCNSLHTTTISMNGRKKNVVSNQLQNVCVSAWASQPHDEHLHCESNLIEYPIVLGQYQSNLNRNKKNIAVSKPNGMDLFAQIAADCNNASAMSSFIIITCMFIIKTCV